jgi:hypothetical protein
MRRKVLHEPWRRFVEALDQEISSPCDLHCFGGFVLMSCRACVAHQRRRAAATSGRRCSSA